MPELICLVTWDGTFMVRFYHTYEDMEQRKKPIDAVECSEVVMETRAIDRTEEVRWGE